MRSVNTRSVSSSRSKPDCRDEETYRLLNAFFQIDDPYVRRQVVNVAAAVLYDEDWASEVLELAEQALSATDAGLNEPIHVEPF